MVLIGIEVILHLYAVDSLKGKRRIVKSITDHVRSRYKISAAEVADLDHLGRATLGFGLVSNSRKQAEVEIIEIYWLEA